MPKKQQGSAAHPEDPEIRFSSALVRLLRYFNLLEENVGLSISHLENPDNPRASYPRLAITTAEQKLLDWKALLEKGGHISNDAAKSGLYGWFERANNARCIRNRYIHGHWEYLPLREEKPVGVRASAWLHEKFGAMANEQMSMAELEASVDELENVFQEFMSLRKKYGV
jgi:hypothetical protein